MDQYLQITKDIIDQTTWYLHSQRNDENTAIAKLEIVAIVKMNANVANACTHWNHAMKENAINFMKF